jgi:hypothetical protein
MSFEEVLKIPKRWRGWDNRSHTGKSRIYRELKAKWYKRSLSYFMSQNHYIYAWNNDLDFKTF